MADKLSLSIEVSADPSRAKAGLDAVSAQIQAMAAKAAGLGSSVAQEFRRIETGADAAAEAIRKTVAAQPAAGLSSSASIAQATAAAAAARNQAISASLNVAGVRSTSDIRGEIAEVNRAVASLRANGAAAQEIARASQAAQTKIAALNAELHGTSPAAAAAGISLAGAGLRMAAIAAAALAAQQAISLLRNSVATGIEFESLKTQFQFASGGDVAKAAEEMGFASSLANKLGLELVGTSKAYAKLQSAAAGTSLAGEKTRTVFQAVASAGAVMGLTAEEQSGALLAISQMMSKGTVSAEELRGQLGERLPGAFRIAAEAMGVTQAELGKLLEEGALTAEAFIPRFAEALQKSVEESLPAAERSARAQLQRLENAFTEFKLRIASSGLLDKVSEALEKITARIGEMADSGELDRLASQFAAAFSGAVEFMANAALVAERFSGALVGLGAALASVFAGGRVLAGLGASYSLLAKLIRMLDAVVNVLSPPHHGCLAYSQLHSYLALGFAVAYALHNLIAKGERDWPVRSDVRSPATDRLHADAQLARHLRL